MTLFEDYRFFFWLIILLLPAVILGVREKSLKGYTLFCSLLFICLALWTDVRQLCFMAVYYVWELALVKGYCKLRAKYGRQGKLYGCAVLLSILPLIFCKLSPFLPFQWFNFLGVSYLTFKTVQIIIEAYDGIIEDISIFSYSSYLLFFPVVSSGPIDRSRRFLEDFNRILPKKEYLDLAGDGLQSIMLGLVYKFVLGGILYRGVDALAEVTSWYGIIGYTYCYGFYLFFDFAGYSLMAVGVSRFFGIETPGNFNKPFISRDIKEFWDRWHITLSHWFRDFIFSRFMMKAIKKKWFHTRLQKAGAAFLVNMFIMGAWHGLTVYYLLYGVYHGCLLAFTEVYQKKSKFYKKYKGKKWYQTMSWFLTMQAVMFGFLIFSGRFTQLLAICFSK